MFDEKLLSRSQSILSLADKQSAIIATAESCTGGGLAEVFTAVAGASKVFHGGIIAYHNSWKEKYLSVQPTSIAKYGAVSDIVANEMVLGLLSQIGNITHGIAITGLAGNDTAYRLDPSDIQHSNDGDSAKPDGLVFIAVADKKNNILVEKYQFSGDRQMIRQQTLLAAMDLLEKLWHK
ncbi:MAG: CinA family protein [Alphaproteobacteria bacterium]